MDIVVQLFEHLVSVLRHVPGNTVILHFHIEHPLSTRHPSAKRNKTLSLISHHFLCAVHLFKKGVPGPGNISMNKTHRGPSSHGAHS